MAADIYKTLDAKAEEFAAFLDKIPKEVREKMSSDELALADKEHADFRDAFKLGDCYLCRKPLATFSSSRPCVHWLLKPKGFKKKHFPSVTAKFNYFQIAAFLRWVANEDRLGKNINDMPSEGTGKILESTIRYLNLEWSFSCGETDFRGHPRSSIAAVPHYHFQMRIDKKPFIDFGDFHTQLTESDYLQIQALHLRPNTAKAFFPHGESIRDVLENDQAIEFLLNSPTLASEETSESPIHIQSMVMADEGSTIKGEDLYAIIQEAKKTGVSVAGLLHKLPNSNVEIQVMPGPGVVEQATRSTRMKK